MNTFVTSDTHFGHSNLLRIRPMFASVEEMDETLINNWNRVVQKRDIVYFLGDLAWRKWKYYFDQLHGQIHIIKGNHDKMSTSALLKAGAHSVQAIKDIKYAGRYITLCHYPMQTWNKAHHGALHLHGHCHSTKRYIDQAYLERPAVLDVGVDGWDFTPISLDVAIQYIQDRLDS